MKNELTEFFSRIQKASGKNIQENINEAKSEKLDTGQKVPKSDDSSAYGNGEKIDQDKIIANLQAELEEAEKVLKYKQDNHEKQLEELRTSILLKLHKDVGDKLENLTKISKKLNPRNSFSLDMVISNMKQMQDDLKS